MPATEFDLERIRAVLSDATGSSGHFSQRGLSKDAGESRDCVGDIINGRNKNPTMKVLANLANAMGSDLSVFGISEPRAEPPTEAELEDALRDMLPGMPRGSLDKRARYLAEAVGRALKLPPGQRALHEGSSNDLATGAPPLSTTN
ncbi:helix-turn-helix transcriptional regulator [Sphingomonas sp. CARO-RG-8B-R24-01]|uniref:helix-turn-helix domain-containing protein n=1 Tax=Sphingomonas sp. CARO-RG-8B-R24-01 TaxID=2914831 RepID=UPI001F58AF9F|nr:helix-turn-helix transcriptional regulator [Sphingomonas sp. CARO-RG-8B-R24-01]